MDQNDNVLSADEFLAAAVAVEHMIDKHAFSTIRSPNGTGVNLERLRTRLIKAAQS